MRNILKNNLYDILLVILIIIFIIIKIPYLSLPYYWDEAWVYGPALRIMEVNKLSLMPDALPVYYSRGHPLLFHFSGALWLRIFGTSLLASHLFALFISVCLIISVYVFCSKLFSKQAGIIAALILFLQPIFLAQSVLVLPEVMLSLFSLLSIFFFIKEKWFCYIIFTTCALFTKETGIVALATSGIWLITDTFIINRKNIPFKVFFKRSAIIAIPLIIISAFFIYQKKINGWYFFPEHVNYLLNDNRSFLNKLESYSAYQFIYWGRNVLSSLIIISLFFYFYFKKHTYNKANKPISLLAIFIILFLITISLNFYSDRYTMCMMAPFAIITAFLLNEVIKKKIFLYITIAAFSIIQITIHIPKRTSSDHNLGYADAVKTHQQMVSYCIENNFRDKKIFTHFLMLNNLENPYCGYLSNDQKFSDVSSTLDSNTAICIFSNMEGKEDYEKIKAEGKFILKKRFESCKAWSEIYEK